MIRTTSAAQRTNSGNPSNHIARMLQAGRDANGSDVQNFKLLYQMLAEQKDGGHSQRWYGLRNKAMSRGLCNHDGKLSNSAARMFKTYSDICLSLKTSPEHWEAA